MLKIEYFNLIFRGSFLLQTGRIKTAGFKSGYLKGNPVISNWKTKLPYFSFFHDMWVGPSKGIEFIGG